jgi:hypothetical protein
VADPGATDGCEGFHRPHAHHVACADHPKYAPRRRCDFSRRPIVADVARLVGVRPHLVLMAWGAITDCWGLGNPQHRQAFSAQRLRRRAVGRFHRHVVVLQTCADCR